MLNDRDLFTFCWMSWVGRRNVNSFYPKFDLFQFCSITQNEISSLYDHSKRNDVWRPFFYFQNLELHLPSFIITLNTASVKYNEDNYIWQILMLSLIKYWYFRLVLKNFLMGKHWQCIPMKSVEDQINIY